MSVPFDRLAADLYIRFLYYGRPGLINICYIPHNNADLRPGEFFHTTDEGIERAVDYSADLARRSFSSIYIRTTTLTERPAWGRGYAKDTRYCSHGWADLDFGSPGHKRKPNQLPLPPTAEDAYGLVAAAGLPEPTFWVFSGGGWYPLWQWSRELSIEEATEIVERIQKLLLVASAKRGWHYGSGVGDMARVLRLAGSSNMKTHLPRPCHILNDRGTGLPVDPAWFPPAPSVETVRAINPAAAPPPKKTTTPYRDSGRRGPWDVFDEMVEWPDLLQQHGLTHVGSDSISELYVRDGASSKYSLKVMHATSCAVNWSESLDDLPVGLGLTKAAFLAYMTGYGGDRSELLRDLLSGENTAGVAQDVIEAMASVGSDSFFGFDVTVLGRAAKSQANGSSVEKSVLQAVAQEDWEAFLNTFTSRGSRRMAEHRELWMYDALQRATDKLGCWAFHASRAFGEVIEGRYSAHRAAAFLDDHCPAPHDDRNHLLRVALAATLSSLEGAAG